MFSIGELSKSSGVKVPTIRYYEQVGLLQPADRSEGNQRRYERDGLKRLVFIRHARDLGFSLDDIRSLLTLSEDNSHSCTQADEIVARHLDDVRARIAKLARLETELVRMTQCEGHSVADCEVIESLADHTHCLHEH
ncbi:MerR family transcriptional regulator [Cohaesibacter celericrescens]|uniref:Transcriptional regulator n=1 Tax=Cohaesibacter celericrescens TaxID=2067669 RepID=A0A2N5XQK4_9HYPH|nr:helix-turn-helix domain-containing protein [Cohaesibacter celericrescens]PLW76745.1 transcriptional regulator [Cohaesibacter celericrescens]